MARQQGVGECPVPFVFATCLKTSPSCYPPRILLFPCACVFTKRKRTRTEGMPDLSFDSTAFLPIRQTFDSFTWEPRNSSWWLSSSSPPASFPSQSLSLSLFLYPLYATSWSAFRYQIHVSWPSMPLDMSSLQNLTSCVSSNANYV